MFWYEQLFFSFPLVMEIVTGSALFLDILWLKVLEIVQKMDKILLIWP